MSWPTRDRRGPVISEAMDARAARTLARMAVERGVDAAELATLLQMLYLLPSPPPRNERRRKAG